MKDCLITDYYDKMDKSLPWGDYPRPSLRRDSYLSLNGEWDFAVCSGEPSEYTEKILVPFPPESELSGIARTHKAGERLYYRRRFSLPDGFKRERTILHFGAVDQICEAFLNGTSLGSHEGGYTPFSFDITDLITDGENELRLTVIDDLSHDYPYGKQRLDRGGMWYTPVSGIWQSVWIEALPSDAIESIKITPSTSSVRIEVSSTAVQKRLTLTESGEVIEFEGASITLSPASPHLWTPEDPYLYYFTLEAGEDKIESYFALREIGVRVDGGVSRLTLNGVPYLFNGLLDQGYFPDGIYLPATSEAYCDDILAAKALGFNTLRKHIKIEPDVFYYLCDKLGVVVFQDMINNSDYSFIRDTALPTVGIKRIPDKRLNKDPKRREIFRENMKRTVELLYNHPSVLYYTVFNEGWGQFTADEVYREARALDETRIFDATSGWFWQKESDVFSHHVYFKRLNLKVSEKRPTVLSEFGGYSYRCEGHLFGDKNYGYKSFAEKESFENAVADLYLCDVLPLVKRGVSALIYTQLSDVEDETNGFLTYDRCVMKVDPARFAQISKKLKDGFYETIDML